MIEIDKVISISLTAIYTNDLLKNTLFLKGGQYLRVIENIKNRFSADTDFSVNQNIENSQVFFDVLKSSLSNEFHKNGYYLFSFKSTKQPKMKSDNTPDHWSGWAVEYKIISEDKRNLPQAKLDSGAIVPLGATSPKITLDISEYEYCNSVEKVKVEGTLEISSYSRALVVLEKIRAICQQHPKYPFKNGTQRSRDYYDIEKLWSISVGAGDLNHSIFIQTLKDHLIGVFNAKEVDLTLLHEIFEIDFVEIQKSGWGSVTASVEEKMQSFEYYLENLKNIVNEIHK